MSDVPDSSVADAVVLHVPEASRYELRLGERLIGVADYKLRDDRIFFTHTEVEQALNGRGLGTQLVAAAVSDARAKGLAIVPVCPFVADYVERHEHV